MTVADGGRSGPASEPDFDEIYVRAGSDLSAVPWASLTANAALVAWLDRQPEGGGAAALVVGCGLGDDAEELARRAYHVTAYDVSPTAIELCRHRFPGSPVDYLVADLFAAPRAWTASFALVVEIRTLQSLPLAHRGEAARAIAQTVAPRGRVFVRALGRQPDEPLGSRPWPLTRDELTAFAGAGLVEVEFSDEALGVGVRAGRVFTAVYARAEGVAA